MSSLESYKSCLWVTRGIIVSRDKLRLLNQMSKFRTDEYFLTYFSNYKSIYKRVIKAAKLAQNCNFINSSENKCKSAWKVIKGEIGTCNDAKVQNKIKIVFNNCELTDPMNIGNVFNEYFIKVSKLSSYLGNSVDNAHDGNVNVRSSFYLIPTDFVEITNIIMNLKTSTSSGLDNINSSVFKRSFTHILTPLTYLINLSLTEGSLQVH